MYSTASRARAVAARVLGHVVRFFLHFSRAFATAIANPQLRIAGRSITSSPTKHTSDAFEPGLFQHLLRSTSVCRWIPCCT